MQCMCRVLAYSMRFGNHQPLPTPPHHTQSCPKTPAVPTVALACLERLNLHPMSHPTSIKPSAGQLKFDAALCGQAKATKRKVTKATWRLSVRLKQIPVNSI